MKKINTPISVGELFDKITILEIKRVKIKDKNKLIHVKKELTLLKKIIRDKKINKKNISKLISQLKNINLRLWNVEDKLRIHEKNKSFKSEFITLARKVYFMNDKRAKFKNKINIQTKSQINEVKSYEEY
tara:strand:- start:234 stop:623 length:390 start_codon:yes stop_codon:yes gene_type:complete